MPSQALNTQTSPNGWRVVPAHAQKPRWERGWRGGGLGPHSRPVTHKADEYRPRSRESVTLEQIIQLCWPRMRRKMAVEDHFAFIGVDGGMKPSQGIFSGDSVALGAANDQIHSLACGQTLFELVCEHSKGRKTCTVLPSFSLNVPHNSYRTFQSISFGS